MSTETITQALSRFSQLLVDTGLARPDQLRGCTADETRQVQDSAGHPLPAAYLHFLERFGRGAGEFWRGSTVFFPDMLSLFGQEGLVELAQEMDVALPQQDRLVFFTHQGYDYLWLDLSTGAPDPPVWELLDDGLKQPEQISDTFTQLLLDHSTQLAADLARLRTRRRPD